VLKFTIQNHILISTHSIYIEFIILKLNSQFSIKLIFFMTVFESVIKIIF
jgi:hypothetical protein